MEKVKKNINNSLVTFSCDFGSMYDMDNQVRSKFSCSTYLWSKWFSTRKKGHCINENHKFSWANPEPELPQDIVWLHNTIGSKCCGSGSTFFKLEFKGPGFVIGEHVQSEISYFICIRHLFRSKAVANLKLFSENGAMKRNNFFAAILYHLI